MRFGNEKTDPLKRHLLPRQNDIGKSLQPRNDIKCFLVLFKLVVISPAFTLDRKRKSDEGWLPSIRASDFSTRTLPSRPLRS
jgi:hypothetical protein